VPASRLQAAFITKKEMAHQMNTPTVFQSGRRVLFSALVLGVTALSAYQVQAATTQLPIPKGVALQSWQQNGANGQYVLQLIDGKPLTSNAPIKGKVMSDSDCTPDANGLSHCHNIVQLANGKKITLVDTHNMQVNRCLGAGEQITLKKIDQTWMMATVAKK